MPALLGATSFAVIVAGADVSTRLSSRLLDLTVNDKAGTTSDTAALVLDDAGGRIAMPAPRSPVAIILGGVPVFTGFVDQVRSSGDRDGGRKLSVEAAGFDTGGKAKEPQERHWDDADLSTVLNEAGQLGGLSGIAVHGDLAGITRDYWAMDGESPVAFARRLARELGATFKIAGDRGVFVPRGGGIAASGKPLVPIPATAGGNLISWDLAPTLLRPGFAAVRGRWYDFAAARWRTATEAAGGGEAEAGLAESAFDADTASAGAKSEATNSARGEGGGTVTITGNPAATAEAPCIVTGARPGVDGTWRIDGVTHRLTRGAGYVTELALAHAGA